jgi:hypothetical protein
MKKISLCILLAGLTLAGAAQKTINDPNAEKRNVSGFHAIEIGGGVDLYLSQGDEAVAVSANEAKYRDRIKTEVKNGVLKIWYETNSNINVDWGNRKLKAYVSFKELDNLSASGGSDVKTEGAIQANRFTLHVSGGSDFDGKINTTDLTIEQTGGSDVSVSGKTNSLRITASGGSDFDGYELISENCTASATGGSDINVTVNKELNATASGGSDVHYKGNATVKENKSGGSGIKKSGK